MEALRNGMLEALEEEIKNIVKVLGSAYGFSWSEGMLLLEGKGLRSDMVLEGSVSGSGSGSVSVSGSGSVVKEKYEKPKIMLPWTGKRKEKWCNALKPNGGLLSQCSNEGKKDGFCTTHHKELTEKGKLRCGTVDDRLKADKEGVTFLNPSNGKAAEVYAVYMAKAKIKKEDAIAEATRLGLTIPEKEFVIPEKKKGRPKKAKKNGTKGEDELSKLINRVVAAKDTSSESESDPSPEPVTTEPVKEPTPEPVKEPSPEPVKEPTPEPLKEPTPEPVKEPSPEPVKEPTPEPVKEPTPEPVKEPTPEPVNTSDELQAEEPDPDYDAETEDEDDCVEVKIWFHNGTKYLKDAYNQVYDVETQDIIGTYVEDTDKIQPKVDVSSDEEEDDDDMFAYLCK